MKIFAIPSYEGENKKECFIPPVQPVPVIRKSGPQTAFVVASNDPKYQGRVRITYPWQSLGTQIQERLDAATSALEEAQEYQERLSERTAQLKKEYNQLLIEKEEMEEWARMSDSEREIRRKGLEDEIKTLEQSIQNRENAISQANKAVRDKEYEIDNLPADTENREARLTELEEEKQILILKKSDTIQENEPKIAEEKELLARKKAHLAELAKVEDKSKKDAVLKEKQGQLDTVGDDLKTSEEQEKAGGNRL
jgi:chromosome segregation ATPase